MTLTPPDIEQRMNRMGDAYARMLKDLRRELNWMRQAGRNVPLACRLSRIAREYRRSTSVRDRWMLESLAASAIAAAHKLGRLKHDRRTGKSGH